MTINITINHSAWIGFCIKMRKAPSAQYDNEAFFAEYAKMARSREGLSAAGEWHQLEPLFPGDAS